MSVLSLLAVFCSESFCKFAELSIVVSVLTAAAFSAANRLLTLAYAMTFAFERKSICFYFFQDVHKNSQSLAKFSSGPYCHQ